ncbi:MAG: hypothetical protein ACR2M4_05595 [Actinomycetota bacterium]
MSPALARIFGHTGISESDLNELGPRVALDLASENALPVMDRSHIVRFRIRAALARAWAATA